MNNVNDNLLLAGASVEDRLRAAVRYKNIRIREFFRDFDPLRKGIITGLDIRSSLASLTCCNSEPVPALSNSLLQYFTGRS